MLVFLLFQALPFPLRKFVYKRGKGGNLDAEPVSETEKRGDTVWDIIFLLVFIYSIFLPLRLGTAWFYTGLAFFVLGLILTTILAVSIAATPPDEPFTKGLYRYSRHPIYLTMFLRFVGVGIASASWVFLLFSASFLVAVVISVSSEERDTLEKYGDSYRGYINRTPRWIGIPKS
jgi:protein-S-isoprenylcysteine O-methyltransferase Ste14